MRACALLPAVTGNLCRPGTLDPWPEPRVQLAGGRFATPSGRVELASRRAERDGYLRLPEPSADPPPGGGRLRPARGNLNRLNPGTKSDLGESSSVHGIEVAITPAAHRAGLGKCAGKMLAR